MAQLFFNNATSTLASSISAGATSFTVASGQGAEFPVTSGNYFYATIDSEVVKVTARDVDTFTCEETVSAHSAGDVVAHYVTAEMLQDLAQASGNGQVLEGHELRDYVETVATPSIATGVLSLDLSRPYHVVNLNQNVTSITFSNLPPNGAAASYTIEFIQDASGGKTVAFPSSFKTAGGAGITIAAAANNVSLVVCVTRDGGTTYRAGLFGAAFS